ncbi:hypothetical protein E8E12_003031 [Didymella heteroderae]|uniref:LysM domain-containing protein n=1 Tax=Didymella heteroderae TaxID=1769908 RepID=A0A9P4WR20_9PLEO|nr:hypothetical protein E8E12_003031 [Didymella heteroderae]
MSNYGIVATLPLAPGTSSNCHYYYNQFDSLSAPAVIDASQQHLRAHSSKTSCEAIADTINVDVEQLIRLNPSLDRGNCVLEPGFSYCADEAKKSKTLADQPSEIRSTEPPICSFDPKVGEYICPDQPICRFDPEKGEYVCPTASQSKESGQEEEGDRAELR